MSNTPRLQMPMLAAGQAGKEMLHNEALMTLDCLTALALDGIGTNSPPTSPATGACYTVGSAPSGVFAGKSGRIACFSEAGWRFAPPVEGQTAIIKASGSPATYRAGVWDYGTLRADSLSIAGVQVVSTRSGAIASPNGGVTIDTSARTAIDAILVALRHHGLIA